MSTRTRLVRNVSAFGALQAANYVVPIVVTPYLARTLGLELYGVVAFVQAVEGYLLIVTEFGFSLWGVRQAAILARDRVGLGRCVTSIVALRLTMCIPAGLALAGIAAWGGPVARDPALFVLAFAYLVAQALYLDWLFQGIERTATLAGWTLAGRIGATLLVFVLVRSPEHYVRVVVLQVLGTLVAAAGLWLSLIRTGIARPVSVGAADLRHAAAGGLPVLGARLFSVVYVAATPVVGLWAGPEIVGRYSIGERVVTALVGLSQPLTQGTYPVLASVHHESPARFPRLATRLGLALAAGAGLAAIGVAVFAGELTWLIAGDSSPLGTQLLRILSVGVLLGPLSAYLSQLLVLLGRGKRLTAATVTASVIFIVGVYPAYRAAGAVGIAALVVVCQAISVTLAAFAIQPLAGTTDRPGMAEVGTS